MLPFPVLPPPARLAARALNALLRRESWARERLSRHSGKTVRFVLGTTVLGFAIDSEGYTDAADAAIVPDVTLSVDRARFNPVLLFEQARTGAGRGAQPFADMMHISGDAGLAQVVADLAAHLRWDAEDDLARLIGDIPALRLATLARTLPGRVRDTMQRLGANAAEYLAHERRVLTPAPALDMWRAGVAGVQSAADSLDARVQRLQARLDRIDGRYPGSREVAPAALPRAQGRAHGAAAS